MIVLCLYRTLPANASHFELMEFVKAHQSGMQCSVPGHIEETITIARRLNVGLSISGLPNELLCQIFLQYILMVFEADDADYDYFGSAYDFDRSADELPFGWMWWLILTRVCRRWRTITLSTPALWVNLNTRIYPKRPNILRKFFERSGALPLDIRVVLYLSRNGTSPEEIRSPLRMVLRESSRIQSLVLKLPIISVDESITNELGGPFTQLQTVTVDALWGSTDPERSLTSGLNLLPVIFTKMPQNLHTLRLSNVSVDWRSLAALPPTIIHLNLSQSLDRDLFHDVVHPDCTLDHVLDTLDNLPYLQELVLSSTLPQQLGSTRLVHLRHLKHLFLRESIPSGLVLFLCLAFPLTTEPRLMISLEGGLDSDWDRHWFSMPSPFAHSMAVAPQDCAESATEMAISLRATYCNVEVNASACSVCKSSLAVPSAHGPSSKGWQRYRSCSKPHREKFTITDTVEQDDSSGEVLMWYITNAIGIGSMRFITDLNIDLDKWDTTDPTLVQILGYAEMVERLMVAEFITIPAALGNTSRGILLPRLKVLKIGRTPLAENHLMPRGYWNADWRNIDAKALCEALEVRQATGHELPVFCLAHSCKVYISSQMRSRLFAAVGQHVGNFCNGLRMRMREPTDGPRRYK